MKHRTSILFLAIVFLFTTSCNKDLNVNSDFLVLSGEPTSNSIILQGRTSSSDTLIHDDVPGLDCEARLQWSADSNFRKLSEAAPVQLNIHNDFIAREKVTGLEPASRYFFRIKAELPGEGMMYSKTGTFKTLPGPDTSAGIRFAIATGFNYEHYYGLDTTRNRRYADEPRMLGATGMDSVLGFEAFETVLEVGADFFIANGDVVYYDKPSSDPAMWARTAEELRAKWHRYFSMPRNREMSSEIPVYYLKDDHDHRYNDCDTTGDRAPSSQLGIDIFREQVPVVDPGNADDKTYRTHRMGKHMQLWFVEGRDYRSPNSMKDTVGKTIWGKEQKEWLMETLLASDATYKILVSPTPMIGPDDAYKEDNHTNPGGFQTERDEFFGFLEANELIGNGFYIICGDRHWQYHSIHPNGLQEFSCGAFVDQNSRAGRLPGDPASTDPEGKLAVPYVQTDDWGGGFLEVDLRIDQQDPELHFIFKDIEGNARYSYAARNTSQP